MIGKIQKQIEKWRAKNFGPSSTQGKRTKRLLEQDRIVAANVNLLGVQEEVGELSHCFLKMIQGIRGYNDEIKYRAEAKDAVGDIVIYLMGFCDAHEWSLEQIVHEVAGEVMQRDWHKDPEEGILDVNAITVKPPHLQEKEDSVWDGPENFYTFYFDAILAALFIVLGQRKKDYNQGVSIREYFEFNGLFSPLQMVDTKTKRAYSGLTALDNTDDPEEVQELALKVMDSCIDAINYAAFTVAETMCVLQLHPDVDILKQFGAKDGRNKTWADVMICLLEVRHEHV